MRKRKSDRFSKSLLHRSLKNDFFFLMKIEHKNVNITGEFHYPEFNISDEDYY